MIACKTSQHPQHPIKALSDIDRVLNISDSLSTFHFFFHQSLESVVVVRIVYRRVFTVIKMKTVIDGEEPISIPLPPVAYRT